MSGKKKLVVLAVLLVVVIAAAAAAYGVLASQNGTGGLTQVSMSNNSSESEADGSSASSANSSATDSSSTEANSANTDGETSDSSDSSSKTLAPDFTIYDRSGNEITLSQFKGQLVVINFWTSWCTYCDQEMPGFQSAFEEYGDRVCFLMIDSTSDSSETAELADAYIADGGYTFPYYYDTDGSAASAYSLRGYPSTFIVDAEGYLAAYASGMVDEDTLKTTIESML